MLTTTTTDDDNKKIKNKKNPVDEVTTPFFGSRFGGYGLLYGIITESKNKLHGLPTVWHSF